MDRGLSLTLDALIFEARNAIGPMPESVRFVEAFPQQLKITTRVRFADTDGFYRLDPEVPGTERILGNLTRRGNIAVVQVYNERSEPVLVWLGQPERLDGDILKEAVQGFTKVLRF